MASRWLTVTSGLEETASLSLKAAWVKIEGSSVSTRTRTRGGQPTEPGTGHSRCESSALRPLFIYPLRVPNCPSGTFMNPSMYTMSFCRLTLHFPLSPTPLLLKPFFLTSPLHFCVFCCVLTTWFSYKGWLVLIVYLTGLRNTQNISEALLWECL